MLQQHTLEHSPDGPRGRPEQNAIVRIWRAFGLQPHRVENFKFSKDPQFVEKVRDIVGLYLNRGSCNRAVCG